MFTYVYFHFRCFKCDHNTLSLHPRKAVWGDYVVYQPLLIPGYLYYIREKLLQVEMTYCIQILPPPSPLFHKEKRSVVKSFKLTRKCQQISGFLFNTSEKYIFFQNILKGQLSPLPHPPPLRQLRPCVCCKQYSVHRGNHALVRKLADCFPELLE